MTVKELIALLVTMPGDNLVVLQADPEGNSYSPLAGADTANYDKSERMCGYASLTPELTLEGYTEEDLVDGQPCVVLYPLY